MVWYSCIADRVCWAVRGSRRRRRLVRRCVWGSCHSGRTSLCIGWLHEGAALLCGFGLCDLSMCAAAVIRLSCGAGWLSRTARRICSCHFSRRTERNRASMILHRCAAARMGFRLGMYGLFLLRILRDRAAHDGLHRSCGMIRRIGCCFSCRGCCIALWCCHMSRRTSGAGRHGCFACRIGLFAICGRRCLRKCTRHLFGGSLHSIRLRGNGFLTGYGIRAALLRRRAMMINAIVCLFSA